MHLRTQWRDDVLTECRELADEGGLRMLVGPEIGGWVSAYPSGYGQDGSLAGTLARRLGCPVIHAAIAEDHFSMAFCGPRWLAIADYDLVLVPLWGVQADARRILLPGTVVRRVTWETKHMRELASARDLVEGELGAIRTRSGDRPVWTTYDRSGNVQSIS